MPPRPRKISPRPQGPLVTLIALLRGINVGGKNLVPMKDLAALFEEAGCTAVETYIQSGNVIFQAPKDLVPGLPALLAKRIEERFAVQVPVVLRDRDALARVLTENPYLAEGPASSAFHVMFLASAPTPAALARLDPARSPTDRFTVLGAEVYLHCPNGLARTKLTNDYFDRALGTTSTVRNWRTVNTLVERAMAKGGAVLPR